MWSATSITKTIKVLPMNRRCTVSPSDEVKLNKLVPGVDVPTKNIVGVSNKKESLNTTYEYSSVPVNAVKVL